MARRTIAVSAPDVRSAELVAELRAADLVDDAGETTALWIVVADRLDELRSRLAALPGSAPALVVTARHELDAVLEVMRSDVRVIGVVGAGEDAASVVAHARGLLGDVEVPPSVSLKVADAASSHAALDELRAAAIAAGLVGARVDAVEQCADELITNALFAAPIDERGGRVFASYTPRRRLDLRTQHDVSIGYGRDGNRFVVTVRDAFGSLDRERVLDRLYAAAHEGDVVERKVAGAGLGLFLVARESNGVAIEIVPGASTTISCSFEPGRAGPATRFALRVHAPAAQRTHARVVRTAAARRRRLVRASWGLATAVTVVLVTLLALYQPFSVARLAVVTTPPDATVEINGWVAPHDGSGRTVAVQLLPFSNARVNVYRRGFAPVTESIALQPGARTHAITLAPVATLLVESEPAGATVEIAGKASGTTPLAITSLPPGDRVVVAFTRPGYVNATAQLVVPARSATTRHVQTLARDSALVQVTLVSEPPGARVQRVGQRSPAERTYTPAEVVVPKDAETRFVLEMHGRVPHVVVISPETADGASLGGALVPGTAVHFLGSAGTTVSVSGAPHCEALAVPADCTLAPGTYEIMATAGGAPTTRKVVVTAEPLTVEL